VKKPIKIIVFLTITLAILFIFINIRSGIPKASNINILFILLDSARSDHFSCYGYDRNTTPNIDLISRKGAIFLNHFSQGTSTYESLQKIFFSRYYSIPVVKQDYYRFWLKDADCQIESPLTIFKKYDDEQIILPEILSLNGYKTILFSEHPYLIPNNSYLSRKFDEFYNDDYFSLVEHEDLEIVSRVISWLERNKRKKFFIYCHIMSPHIPYRAKKEDREFLSSEMPGSVELVRKKSNGAEQGFTSGWNSDEVRILEGLYDGNLKYTDKWIGVLFNKLKQLGLEKNTLLIITSDHGEMLGEHDFRGHGIQPWEPLIHVPLIMTYPSRIPPGTAIKGMTESVDIMPTILDICNIRIPKNKSMDGISLVEFIKHPNRGKSYIYSQDMIRSDEYKYILNEDLLYDLDSDPKEEINISNKNHVLKEKLMETYEQKMYPYKLRYENSKNNNLIGHSFYYLLSSFKIIPDDTVTTCYEPNYNKALMKEAHLDKPYVLNLSSSNCHLAYFPKKAPSLHLTLFTKVPIGNYQVSILIKTLKCISYPVDRFGLKFRFNSNGPLILPSQLRHFVDYNGFNYYIELGESVVRNEKFSVEIEFIPPDENIYIIQLVKFVPCENKKEIGIQRYNKNEIDRQLERLRSLGYSQ